MDQAAACSSTARISASGSSGLVTKPLAPWASTWWRVFSWLSAESTMIGTGAMPRSSSWRRMTRDGVEPVHDRHVQVHQHDVVAYRGRAA